ncbi:MAG TPA: SDR family oxidoreductase [Deltaproteobacteria bacterium]|nr:SDR family oxidoreductase [Deltaproteobacteria bacterium]
MSTLHYGLEDKVAVVTGGSRGIGLEIARELIAQKARVVICGRKIETLSAAAEDLGCSEVMTVQAHIAKEADVENLFKTVMDTFGRVDVLINNVGMNLMTPFVADTEFSLWQKIIDTNLSGTFLCSRWASRIMREQQKGGRIVNVSSIAGRKASPGMGIYGVAKAGIEMLTKVLASELAGFNIQVNAVAPSMVRTEFSQPFWSNKDIYEQIVRSIPLGRIAEPMDVVHPVLFLASDAAGFITGQTLVVDGGATAI